MSENERSANSPPPVRLGLFDIMQVDPLGPDSIGAMYAARLDHLALADELGFDIAFSAERHFLPNFACPSATSWIAAASQRTTLMRLGVMAYTLPIHAPVQLAEDIAVLDHLTNGRLEVGLGLGHRLDEFTALGIDGGQRITSFQERFALLQALWTGGKVAFARGDVTLKDVAIAPTPLQLPHPPLWFAGADPAAAQWAGGQGMALAVGFKPDAALLAAVTAFRAGQSSTSAQGHVAGTVALMRAVVVGDHDEDVVDEVAGHLLRLHDLHGPEINVVEPERKDEARSHVRSMIDNEVMIAGSPDTVAAGIARSRAVLGFDLFLANVHALGASDEQIRRSLQLLAGPVRDRLTGYRSATASG